MQGLEAMGENSVSLFDACSSYLSDFYYVTAHDNNRIEAEAETRCCL